MELSERPEVITWPENHYVYVEVEGPFKQSAPAAWHTLHQILPRIAESNEVLGFHALYRLQPEPLYRAGVRVSAPAQDLPDGFHYGLFPAGIYARWTLKGSYMQLPEACGRVFAQADELELPMRADFFVENYVTDPKTTPEADLVTEILVPTL